jgi:DNA-binding MarR family transcriptional regulator
MTTVMENGLRRLRKVLQVLTEHENSGFQELRNHIGGSNTTLHDELFFLRENGYVEWIQPPSKFKGKWLISLTERGHYLLTNLDKVES